MQYSATHNTMKHGLLIKYYDMKLNTYLCGFLLASSMSISTVAQQTQLEKLDRGAIAINSPSGVFLSWRSLSTDHQNLAFDIYRDGEKITETPIKNKTNFVDTSGSVSSSYTIKAVLQDEEVESTTNIEVWADQCKVIPLQRPAAGVTLPYKVSNNSTTEDYPDGQPYTYSPNDCSVGDVDGDGQYELIVKWDPSNSRDNSHRGYTGNVYLDAYKLDGTHLWRIDLGHNIRAGAHYTQFMVYDFDGDGKAEVACKTAPGTVDGLGKNVLMGSDSPTVDYRSTGSNAGIVMTGSEYLTIFNGETGAEISTVASTPERGKSSDWDDSYGNRSERYLAAVTYLDGQKPSLVMCRGYYTRTTLTAYDFDGKDLIMKWAHDSKTSGKDAYGQGNHNLAVGDVDGDGCDEIVYGACVINNDGSLLYRTGYGHGDAIHFGDLDPDVEGLEVFTPHEEKSAAYGFEMHSAKTGKVLFGTKTGTDIGRGIAADIDPNHRGHEMWVSGSFSDGTKINNVYNCKGEVISTKRPSVNFRLYWDGDLQDELLDGVKIDKWNGNGTTRLLTLSDYHNATSCNTTKATPNLSADILGDWREEVILWDAETGSDLLLFSTVIPSDYKVPTLMHDHIYRMAVACQNVAYNQPPHLGYYLGDYSTAPSFKRLSDSGNLTQTIEVGESILPIKYQWVNSDNVAIEGLPEGLIATIDEEKSTFTIEGTLPKVGSYTFTISTVGGGEAAVLSGSINVVEPVVIEEVAHYSFNETEGTQVYNSVYGEATAVNFQPTWVEGVEGKALELPATPTNRRLEQPTYPQLAMGTKAFTIECWFRSNGATGSDWYLFHKGSHKKDEATGASGKWIGLQYKNEKLTFAIDDDVTKSNVDVPAVQYFNGEWTHLAAVRDRNQLSLKIYINGELMGEAVDSTGDITEAENIVIGNCNVNFNTPFTGAIDNLHIYEGAMNATKIKEQYLLYSNPTGIEDAVSSEASCSIYPTLLVDHFSVDLPSAASGQVVVGLYNTAGLSIVQGTYTVSRGGKLYFGGLENIPSGHYLVVVDVENKRYTQKLIK